MVGSKWITHLSHSSLPWWRIGVGLCMMIRHFWVTLYGDLSGRSILGNGLNKRQAFRESFHGYQIQRVARDDRLWTGNFVRQSSHHPQSCQDLCDTANERFLKVRKNLDRLMLIFGLLSMGKPSSMMFQITDRLQKTALSEKLAKDLKKRGFKFTGPVAFPVLPTSSRPGQWSPNACEWKNGD